MVVDEASRFCVAEYRDYLVYKLLAEREKEDRVRRVLEKLAGDELAHYRFWSRLAGNCKPRTSKLWLWSMLIVRRLLGLTFTLKLLERGELNTIKAYREVLDQLPPEDRSVLEKIIRDEEEHERKIIGSIDERLVSYLGFIALGLSDAIVELMGVYTGFLGATSKAVIAGIAGLIVGVSAAISMASAAYVQAKHEIGKSPKFSALITGLTYIAAVAALSTPYLLQLPVVVAFAVSLLIATLLVGLLSLYVSVVRETSFRREFIETLAVVYLTVVVAYMVGRLLGQMFGVTL